MRSEIRSVKVIDAKAKLKVQKRRLTEFKRLEYEWTIELEFIRKKLEEIKKITSNLPDEKKFEHEKLIVHYNEVYSILSNLQKNIEILESNISLCGII